MGSPSDGWPGPGALAGSNVLNSAEGSKANTQSQVAFANIPVALRYTAGARTHDSLRLPIPKPAPPNHRRPSLGPRWRRGSLSPRSADLPDGAGCRSSGSIVASYSRRRRKSSWFVAWKVPERPLAKRFPRPVIPKAAEENFRQCACLEPDLKNGLYNGIVLEFRLNRRARGDITRIPMRLDRSNR
jgi:hypothetical protein